MLEDRSRVTLFWFTIAMMALVVIVAIVTLLRACGGSVAVDPPLAISPHEVSLCPGEQHQFTIENEVDVTWETSGGTVDESGLFTAGAEVGDYTVTATRRDSRQADKAIVHVIACTPTPTVTPSPTPAPTATPAVTPTPEPPTPVPAADPQGDVGLYQTGGAVEGVPAGMDIRAASVTADLRVELQPTEGVPAELVGWAAEGEVLLWLSLHEPVPTPPAVFTDWLFALDLDGDTTTGRPAGASRINPDLGTEAALGVSYNPANGQYEPYLWVWDAAQEDWTEEPDMARFTMDSARTLIGLAVPLETLAQTVAQMSGVTVAPEAVEGRAAVLSYVGEQGVIDFYPNLPE
jgi:hypothetical protein